MSLKKRSNVHRSNVSRIASENRRGKRPSSKGRREGSSSVIKAIGNTIKRVASNFRYLSGTLGESAEDVGPGSQSKIVPRTRRKLRRKTQIYRQEERTKTLHPLDAKANQGSVYNAIVFFIHCRIHNQVLLNKGTAKWFPFVQPVSNHCWISSAREALPTVLPSYGKLAMNVPLHKIHFLEILRFQPPERLAFFTRVMFYVSINSLITEPSSECCRETQSCKWFPIEDILNFKIDMIWGPEVFDWCLHVNEIVQEATANDIEPGFTHRIFEFTYDNIIKLFKPYRPQIGQITVVPPGSRCSAQDANRIYSDFLRHCYPAFGMTFDSFKKYFLHYRIISSECRNKNNNRIHRYFNAFNYTRSNNLSFEELLLGICEVDYDKKHNNTRIAFLFRFYDKENKGYLNASNFEEILTDLNHFLVKDRKEVVFKDIPESAAITLSKFNVTKFDNEVGVTQPAFIEGIGKHVFRGTSNLCRSYTDIFQAISRGVTQKIWKQSTIRGQILRPIIKRSDRRKCVSCRRKKYKLQSSIVLTRLEPISAQAISSIVDHGGDHLTRLPKFDIFNMEFTKESIAQNTVENVAFWVMKWLREFNRKKNQLSGFMALESERPHLIQILKLFSKTLEPILKAERRCKSCPAPAFIVGDIHGNIEDLMTLEQTIWPRFPTQLVNYVFLGDYVDRGKWSVECALYLFAMKILSPYHITLLRGNHEVRDIQIRYTYRAECNEKYSINYGKEVFELTNRIFDMLPLAVVLDGSMFCCHGGLPECIDTIDEIDREPHDIQYPEMDSLVAWQIMWSDPIKDELFNEFADYGAHQGPGKNMKEGFIFNRKRGTAHWFNEAAFNNFCFTNGLTHMTRAHEVPRYGFELMFDNRLATIFSCSHYCKNDNDCGVLLVSNGKIRVIRIDTSANLPAMDC